MMIGVILILLLNFFVQFIYIRLIIERILVEKIGKENLNKQKACQKGLLRWLVYSNFENIIPMRFLLLYYGNAIKSLGLILAYIVLSILNVNISINIPCLIEINTENIILFIDFVIMFCLFVLNVGISSRFTGKCHSRKK